ncbi:hypothetical protein F5887DRAFT_55172 [Amanita rubescens]|nr:hypothetical protein F5887DRAFT_55172 [Amanita rubescens]
MPFIVKLKKAGASAELTQTILARFDARPSWEDLASKIDKEFSISSNNVGVVFLDEVDGNITLKNEQELQSFYDTFSPSSGKLKFVVQDLQTPYSPRTTPSTWPASSNLSNLSKPDDLTLFCWILNESNSPFAIDIGQSMTVYHLKKAIKKKKERTFDGIDSDTLELWKPKDSNPIAAVPQSTLAERIGSLGGLSTFANKLEPTHRLSRIFSTRPREDDIHIVVNVPTTGERVKPRLHQPSHLSHRGIQMSCRTHSHPG